MPRCMVPHCGSMSGVHKYKGVRFKQWPLRDKELSRKWFHRVRRADINFNTKKWTRDDKVCERHFTADCFENESSLKASVYGHSTPREFIRDDAVPTLILKAHWRPSPMTPSTSTSATSTSTSIDGSSNDRDSEALQVTPVSSKLKQRLHSIARAERRSRRDMLASLLHADPPQGCSSTETVEMLNDDPTPSSPVKDLPVNVLMEKIFISQTDWDMSYMKVLDQISPLQPAALSLNDHSYCKVKIPEKAAIHTTSAVKQCLVDPMNLSKRKRPSIDVVDETLDQQSDAMVPKQLSPPGENMTQPPSKKRPPIDVTVELYDQDLNYESMGKMGSRKKQISLARKAKKQKKVLIDAFWKRNLDKMDFSCLHHPVVIMDKIKTWPAASWTPETLRALLGDKKFNFKIGQQQNEKDGVVWESECRHVEATIGDFLAWLDDQCTDSNPLQYFPRMENWVYLDYKYIAQMFEDQTHIYKDVLWERFGFEGRDGADSTLWMGSEGSYTPCHYDTYGCNLVAQIYGRKRWFLFPPDKMNNLYPTRIPYEESSVFSHVDIKRPDLIKYPLFKETCPIVVTLKPGDVLFVPKHWWHFVESLETSISINTWVELESDHMDRFTESVCQTLVNSLMSSAQRPQEEWLNTGQTSQNHDANLLNLETALKALPMEAPSACNASQLRKRPADIAQSSDQGSELKRRRLQQEAPADTSLGSERGSERKSQQQQRHQAKSETILFQNNDSGICEILKIETAPDFEFDCEDGYSGSLASEMDQLNGVVDCPRVSASSSGANVVTNSVMGPSTSRKASEMLEMLSSKCEFELCRNLNLHGTRHKSPYVKLLDPIPFAEYLEEFTLNERLHENGLKLDPKSKSFQDENPEPVVSSSHVFKSEPVSPSSHDSNSEPVGPAPCEFKSEPVSPPSHESNSEPVGPASCEFKAEPFSPSSQDSNSGPFWSHESNSEQTRTSSHEFKSEPVDPTELVRPASHDSISESVGPSARDLFTKFVNAVTHPEIVRKIAEKLKEEFI